MEVLKGDFIGFSIGNFHSSKLGILRTSDGSRFNESLLPGFSDATAQVPGGDGMYYWKSNYSQKPFSIPIAYDSMTETQLRNLRRAMACKDIIPLVFDERPYKEYLVKPTGEPQLSYICFDEKDQRVYKGEGTLEFTAYSPFARNRHINGKGLKYLNEFRSDGEYSIPEWVGFASNRDEWSESSNMLMQQGDYDQSQKFQTDTPKYGIKVYNAGDLETNFKLFIALGEGGVFPVKTLCLQKNPKEDSPMFPGKILNFHDSVADRTIPANDQKDNKFICVDVKSNLLLGYSAKDGQPNEPNEPTGKIYNSLIKEGDFFTIPPSFDYPEMYLAVHLDTGIEKDPIKKLEYDYLYY